MTDPATDHAASGLSMGALAGALTAKYIALSAYGIWAAAVEIPTFVELGGSNFAVAWASVVAAFAALAALGVIRTWRTGLHRLEKWSTAFFVLAFSSYSAALIIRAVTDQDWSGAPFSIIPLALCALPTVRYYSLVRRGHFQREHKRREH